MTGRALAAVLLTLSACQAAPRDPAGPATPVPRAQESTPTTGNPFPAMGPFAVHPDRGTTLMVAGCPHMNPVSRPSGSNCYGIFPEQCGADRAAAFQGNELDAAAREQIEAIAPPGGIRFIKPGEPVTADLRAGRLNIELGGKDGKTIVKADCA
ncbi:MAG: I78 family peptidase inhibitor [Croceibacterium sp.]